MRNDHSVYLDRISQKPNVMVGKPVVKGTRVPVERVLAHLAETPDFSDLFAAFPHLTIDDVRACFAFASEAVAAQRSVVNPVVAAVPRSKPASARTSENRR